MSPVVKRAVADEYGVVERVTGPSDAEIDVVAVHGLGGHALTTFTGPNGKNWIIDPEFLPAILPKARIFTFGYNANVFEDVVTSRVVDHSNSLLSDLLTYRSGVSLRPILFIGHSLGGIIIKKAMITANMRDRYKSLREATEAIVFLGTPHGGSELSHSVLLSTAQKMVSWSKLRHSSGRLVEELEPFSTTLRDIAQDFVDIANQFEMRSFVEQKPTRLPLKGDNLIVEQGAAVMNHPKELSVPLSETHSSMVKYSTSNDSSYMTITRHVKFLVDEALKVAKTKIDAQLELEQRLGKLSMPVHDYSFRDPVGPCLGQAPSIQRDHFIGRDHELAEMAEILLTDGAFKDQRRLVLGGMGGIGKTQLALAYARRHSHQYNSIFWLNATSEATIATSFQAIAKRIFTSRDYHAIDTRQLPGYVNDWLSHPRNTSWLLIFDNYDEPQTYNIHPFFPNTAYGVIIITTRRADLMEEKQVSVKPLKRLDEGLQILQTRSRRSDIEGDIGAGQLAERLAGLPLALATAGTFLRKSVWTFQQYLDAYEERWTISSRKPLVLTEYQNRTLYTTWELSYDRLKEQEPDAAKLLKLFAYFDHQAIWYELLHVGAGEGLPDWLLRIVNESAEFESIMCILVDHCFIETQITTQTYSIHTCVHDWTIAGLASTLQPWSYWYAFDCVASSIKDESWGSLDHVQYAKFTPHAVSLMNTRFTNIRNDFVEAHVEVAECVAELLQHQDQLSLAGLLLENVLTVREKALGAEHTSTLDTVNNLASLYHTQGKLVEAERMYLRALAGKEKALGAEHTSTLDTVNNLGLLYWDQDKLVEAEQMFLRALAGKEKALGAEHTSTLGTVNNLGLLYRAQGKLVEAEQMYLRALAGYEKALGAEHTSTLGTVNNLGLLYQDQDKLVEAEQIYLRALAGYEKALGAEHTSTLDTVNNLAGLCCTQGKLVEAEQMYLRALAGKEKALGAEHTSTLGTVNNLGLLYWDQGKLVEAEQMFLRVLARKEKTLGVENVLTLSTVYNLAGLCCTQGKLVEAEQMYLRALAGKEKALGAEHTSTLDTVNNLAVLYYTQGKLVEAEQIYLRALAGKEKALGVENISTLSTVYNLAILYRAQGKLVEAEQMYLRALAGYEKALGAEHTSTLGTVNNLGLLYWDQDKLAEAKHLLERAAIGTCKALGSDHPKTKRVLESLEKLSLVQEEVVSFG